MVPAKTYADLWNPDMAAAKSSARHQTSITNVEHDNKSELLELVEKVHANYSIVTKTMNENRDYLERNFNDLSSSYDILAREMSEDAETMGRVLRSASLSDDPAVTNDLLDRLKSCFNAPSHWLMEVMVKAKRQQLTEAHQILKDYLAAKRGDATKVRLIFDCLRISSPDVNNNMSRDPSIIQPETVMVNVTFVTDPGKFFIIQWSDIKEFNQLFTELQDAAPTCPVPDDIIPDQLYAVLSNEKEWHRATVGLPSGIFQVGDGPAEPLYKCFFVDDGRHERISKSNIRVLSKDTMELPPFAKECTMNANFKRHTWRPEITAMFKQWTSHGPHNMKVIAQKESVLYVDLFRLDEGCRMVSVKDFFMNTSRRAPLVAIEEPPAINSFKPKYERLQLQSNPPKYAVVIITKAVQPKDVYIQVEDEDSTRYLHMQKSLQEEFRSATRRSDSYCPSPTVGQPYVVQFDGTQWCRAIVETYHRQAKVFFIDIGHRQIIEPTMSFHKLPNRFMELPAQAIRCSLRGVFPPSQSASFKGRKMKRKDEKFPQEIFSFMPRYEGKHAVAIFEHWDAGYVGHSPKTAELLAGVILYPHGDIHSINVQIGETSMARLVSQHLEIPEHYEIREKLVPQRSQVVPISTAKNQVAASTSRPVSIRDGPSKTGRIPRSFTLLRVMSWKPAEIPKVGARFNAKVTWVNKNGDIYLQNTRSERELEAIRLYLNDKYKDSVSTDNDLLCAPGDLCVAKYLDDWYRCTIKTVNGKEVVVYCDDFGNMDVVDIKDIRLDIALQETPVQVLRCSLHNLQPVGGAPEWSNDQRNFIFKEAAKWTFRTVVKAPGPQVMLMYRKNSCFNTDVVHNRCADFVESVSSRSKA